MNSGSPPLMTEHALDQASLKRIAWRCRRGMLELDLLFTPFVQDHLADLNHAQIGALDALLDMPDNLLWQLLADKAAMADQSTDHVNSQATGQVLAMLSNR